MHLVVQWHMKVRHHRRAATPNLLNGGKLGDKALGAEPKGIRRSATRRFTQVSEVSIAHKGLANGHFISNRLMPGNSRTKAGFPALQLAPVGAAVARNGNGSL
jgi:hypothetical protein